jgi:hypothetical protein
MVLIKEAAYFTTNNAKVLLSKDGNQNWIHDMMNASYLW